MNSSRWLAWLSVLERRIGDGLNGFSGRMPRSGLKLLLVVLGLLWAVYLVYLVLDGLGLV